MVKRSIFFLSLTIAFTGWALWVREPHLSGELSVPVLQDVQVVRDHYGVPHIKARNLHDAQFALGYVQAQDRAFQMDAIRRALSGRLAESFGPKMLASDKKMRTLGILAFAEEQLARHPARPEVMAYLDGVNAAFAQEPRALEHWLVSAPEPFRPAEALAVAHYMALGFAEGLVADPIAGSIVAEFGREKFAALWSDYPAFGATIADEAVKHGTLLPKFRQGLFEGLDAVGIGLFTGSNAWLVAPHKSASGASTLANDPHIGFANPSVWYEAHVTTPELDLYGYYMPLVPYAVIGHTPHHAWGVTMYENDDTDFYVEKPDAVIATRQERIKVKGEDDVLLQVRLTKHGPIVSDVIEGLTQPVSLKWGIMLPENDPMTALAALPSAKSWQEFSGALRTLLAPGLSMLYVDKETIAYMAAGAQPLRGGGADGSVPMDDTQEWEGLLPFEQWPTIVNPKSGVIVSANNKPHVAGPRGYWQPAYRATRIRAELDAKEKVSVADHLALQLDVRMLAAERFLAVVLPLIEAPELVGWNFEARTGMAAPYLYTELRREVFFGAVKDELGERADALWPLHTSSHVLEKLLAEPGNVWWDDVRTAEKETLTEAARAAWQRVKQRDTKWGQVHLVTFRHPFGSIFNIGPYAVDGGREAINNFGSRLVDGVYDIKGGPSTRRVVDMADPFHAWSILPTGESGRRQSKHYADQAAMFVAGRGRQIVMAEEDVAKHKETELWLRPMRKH